MPSDKHNLITDRVDFLLCSMLLSPDTCFFANCSSSNACILVILKLTFILLCIQFLSSQVMISGTCIMALVRDLDKYSASRGAAYVIICLECLPNVRRAGSEMKCDDTC